MLTVTPLKSASGAADYYSATFNYYNNDSQAIRWLGKGAEHLGLIDKEVTKETFLELLEGKLPDGQILQNKKGEHRPGFDMTFSAPKSLSVLVGLGVYKERLLEFHDKAVELTLKKIEKEFAQARINIDGKMHYIDTGNLASAVFRQPTSRENDPQIHSHCVTLNMTFDESGKARSLASDIFREKGVIEQLQNYSTYAGQMYRTQLANMLKDDGFKLTPKKNGLFEIEGFPEEVLKGFSKRSEQIKNEMDKNGWSGSHGASQATQNTRNVKEEHDLDKLQSQWKSEAESIGFNGEKFIFDHFQEEKKSFLETIKDNLFPKVLDKEQNISSLSYGAVSVAIESLSQSSSVLDYKKLKEAALRHTLCSKELISIEDIDKAIFKNISDGNLYKGTCPISKKSMLTTPWVLTQETETLARIEGSKNTVKPISSNAFLDKKLKEYEGNSGFKLTPSQNKALYEFNLTSDRFLAIQGYAGTGKTTILNLSREIAEEKGYTVKGLAVQSSVVEELNKKAGINSSLYQKVYQELSEARKNSLKSVVYVLDESSMLSTTQTHQLVKLIEKTGARLIMVGDDDQLPTVKNGRMFGLSQDYGIKTITLTDIIRQKTDAAKGAVQSAISHEIYDSIQKLSSIRTAKSHQERIALIANEWLSMPKETQDKTLMFASTHKERGGITDLIRERLLEEGSIGNNVITLNTLKPKKIEDNETRFSRYYESGDVVRLNHSFSRYGIKSGEYFSVMKLTQKDITNNTLQLKSDTGKQFTFNLKYLPKYNQATAGLNRYVELYERKSLDISERERIQWTRNSAKDGVMNSTIGVVEKISDESISIKNINGDVKTLNINNPALKHIDHGYALTTYKVQGKEKMYGIGLLESFNKFSATIKNYYVQISRAVYNMTLVTDDKEELIRAISTNDDDKKSAIDHLDKETIVKHADRFKEDKNSIDIASIIDRKVTKASILQQRQSILEKYNDSLLSDDKKKLSKYAYEIITDKTIHRMADNQIGIGYNKLRNEALEYSTGKLKESLSPEEQNNLSTVEKYHQLSYDASKSWIALKSNEELSTETDNLKNLFLRNEAVKLSQKCDGLAHVISKSPSAFKSYLKHYSIGNLNRLGIPQHKIEYEEGVAKLKLDKLAKRTESYEFSQKVERFFDKNNSDCKKNLGLELQTNSKRIHPYLIQRTYKNKENLSDLWLDINKQARLQKDSIYKETLSSEQKVVFDKVKKYKEMGQELGEIGSKYFKFLEGKVSNLDPSIKDKFTILTARRNDIALTVIGDPKNKSVLEYFNLDAEKLKKQALKSEYRTNVTSFINSRANFKAKIELAEAIGKNIKAHYPYIKELDVDKKLLNKYIRVSHRQDVFTSLSDAQRDDYRKVLKYRALSMSSSKAWKQVFSYKESGQKTPQSTLHNAMELTSKRDSQAQKISNKSEFDSYIKSESIDIEKLSSHARNHILKLRELKEIQEVRQGLLITLEQKEHGFTKETSKEWHAKWRDMENHIKQVEWSKAGYKEALKSFPIAVKSMPEKHVSLLNKYDLSLNQRSEEEGVRDFSYEKSPRYDLKLTIEKLMSNPEQSYKAIFGKPKSIKGNEMRFSGGVIVTIKGSKSGLWYDFVAGKGGNPIDALMHERNIDFKEALAIGSDIAGTEKFELSPIIREKNDVIIDNKVTQINTIKAAKSIWNGSIKVDNTLAQKYLKEHRGIGDTSGLNMKFWPAGSSWMDVNDKGELYGRINKIPALIVPAYNKSGHITGVQRIYLDQYSGKKNSFMNNAKFSKGVIKGSAGILQKGAKGSRLYIAEGPETAASIAQIDKKSTVLVSFGLNNMKNLSGLVSRLGGDVIIAGDNDKNPKVDIKKATLEAAKILRSEGVNAAAIFPDTINNRLKTDWNDVLKTLGLDALKAQISAKINTEKSLSKAGLSHSELKYFNDKIKAKNEGGIRQKYQESRSLDINNIDVDKLKYNKIPRPKLEKDNNIQQQIPKEYNKEIER